MAVFTPGSLEIWQPVLPLRLCWVKIKNLKFNSSYLITDYLKLILRSNFKVKIHCTCFRKKRQIGLSILTLKK